MARGSLWGAVCLLLASALIAQVRANINDDRVAARTACYKECLTVDGWDPVCVWNPDFPKPTTHGGGSFVYPNECTAKCMAQYCKYLESCNLEVRYRLKMPSKCYKKVWDIYFGLTVDAPECRKCNIKAKVAKQPAFKEMPEGQCMKACVERDGWDPICVKGFDSNKKIAFGNSCAAACKVFSPTPLYKIKRSKNCKKQFTKTGKMNAACSKCPAGKMDDDLFIDNDRVVAREFCYKACLSRDGWNPVCSWNPAYPDKTTHGGGDSVWPNECTADCMAQYCRYVEWCNLETKYTVTLPKKCEKNVGKIYFGNYDPSISQSLKKKCTTCPPSAE